MQANGGENHQEQTNGNGIPENPTLEDIQEYILTLTEHMRECERSGKYIEAQTALTKIEELKTEASNRRREEMRARHLNEKLEIEEAHLSEFNQFNEFWDKKMQQFSEEAAQAEQEMTARHQEELAKFEEELNNSLPPQPKGSSELLNLRKIEENLARQKDYVEAHKVQQKCLEMEREELAKWLAVRESKIRGQVQLLATKQAQEINALRKRVNTAQEEQRKARSLELERLIQKYHNIKNELEIQQQMEALKLDKVIKTSGSVMRSSFGSRFMSQGGTRSIRQTGKTDSGSKR
eukprot:TRINITY_DN2059_c0_g1_i1.p1 TRINITY_DN2059_c0_g1~~TRINITY_DN2059_c0_g1_i1.p1  ORF type:complete len:293 (-),score=108.02 TRINITY_DN2059_c0_g1_i1:139-1017(-)